MKYAIFAIPVPTRCFDCRFAVCRPGRGGNRICVLSNTIINQDTYYSEVYERPEWCHLTVVEKGGSDETDN